MESVPKVSVLPVPFSVRMRLPAAMLVPLAKLRSFVPPKVKAPPHVTAFAVLSVMGEPLLLSIVVPPPMERALVPMAELVPPLPALFRCKVPVVSVVAPL